MNVSSVIRTHFSDMQHTPIDSVRAVTRPDERNRNLLEDFQDFQNYKNVDNVTLSPEAQEFIAELSRNEAALSQAQTPTNANRINEPAGYTRQGQATDNASILENATQTNTVAQANQATLASASNTMNLLMAGNPTTSATSTAQQTRANAAYTKAIGSHFPVPHNATTPSSFSVSV